MDIEKFIKLLKNAERGLPDNPVTPKGIGTVFDNENVDYAGLKCMICPSKYLQVAADFEPCMDTIEKLKQLLHDGELFANPFLDMDYDDDFGKYGSLSVRNHGGRHRMLVIRELYGDIPVECYVFVGRHRAHNITDDMKYILTNGGVHDEDGNSRVGKLVEKIL